ncbi:putative Metal dependent phosphohydrolase [Spironucleus salmonicida]|uniref:5'-deoxynucleotidase n=1 Tax=Spironucleus salmonicida TaxID=348837 RepID=V6LUD3_9EUKA|nr:putative Metal dependent phosphohydrolase [Spironucleus salmonicida]|eukprot:EST48232.1 HD domain-containing protein [Spironucleus salmonicida]
MLDQIIQIYNIKQTQRTGWVHNSILNPETVGSHSFGVAFLAFQLCPKTLCRSKVVEMALMHDIQESMVGDITPNCGVSVEDKHEKELQAIKIISEKLNNADYVKFFTDYEDGITQEAKFVKNCDKLDMFIQALIYERQGHNLDQFYSQMRVTEFEEINMIITQIQNYRKGQQSNK